MADRLRWWVIPGALLVLVRVVTLGGDRLASAPVVPVAADAAPVATAVDASASRRRLPQQALPGGAIVVHAPAALAGQRGDLRIWRRLDGQREAQPWLTCRPRVRDDGTLPFTGLAAGRYDFVFTVAGGTSWSADDVAVPGSTTLHAVD